ncbi:MAG: SDR family NAD(P)-dependent oxidoreductase [Sphingomonadales bacterium]
MTGQLDGKVALITGATRGIGAAVAELFAREGAHVIAVGRTQGALEELDDRIRNAGGSATLVPLDVTDGPGIDRLGGAVMERWKRLDILVGNAGTLGTLTPLAHLKPKTWDELMAVNVTANWRLIRSFDALLRAADAGRAMFVTSGAGHNPRAYWGGYGATKAALEHLARTWAAECVNTQLRVNLINPGATATAMRKQAMPGEDPATLPTPEDVAGLFLDMALPSFTTNGQVINYRDWAGTPGKA